MRATDFFVLRLLSQGGGFAATSDNEAALCRWRDNYGAVQTDDKGKWRLCYRPQWLCREKLLIPDANAVVVQQTASTNDDVAGLPMPGFVFADCQSAGRGRRGRFWLSLPGAAVLFSAHLPMAKPASGLTVAAGVGLWRVLKQYADVKLKWPNDLLDCRGRKLGGILTEARGGGIVIGVGINLHLTAKMAEAIGKPAAGLADIATAALPPLAELAKMLAVQVRDVCQKFNAEGFVPFLPDALRAHFPQTGAPMAITGGGENSAGVFAGFADDGALLLKSGGGNIVRHLCGEVCDVAGS